MPMHLTINTKSASSEKVIKQTRKKETITTTKWDQEKSEEFNEAINSGESKRKIQEACDQIDESVDCAVNTFNEQY